MEYLTDLQTRLFGAQETHDQPTHKQQHEQVATAARDTIRQQYEQAKQTLDHLTSSLDKLRQDAEAQWDSGKRRMDTERDWSAGYSSGRLDQATQRTPLSLKAAYAAGQENIDWVIGYLQGRMDEASDESVHAYNEAREKGWLVAYRFRNLLDKSPTEQEPAHSELMQHRAGWLRSLYDWMKQLYVNRTRENIARAERHAHEVEDRLQDLRDHSYHLGVKIFEQLQQSIQQAQERVESGLAQLQQKTSDTAEHAYERLSDAVHTASEQAMTAAHRVGQTAGEYHTRASQAVKDSAEQGAQQIGQAAKDTLADTSQKLEQTGQQVGEHVQRQLASHLPPPPPHPTLPTGQEIRQSIEDAYATTASFMAERIDALMQHTNQTANDARDAVRTLEQELEDRLKEVVRRTEQVGQSDEARAAIANEDRRYLSAYIRSMLARLEHQAHDAYANVLQLLDETDHQLRGQRQQLLAHVQAARGKQTGTQPSDISELYDTLAGRIIRDAQHVERIAKQRYSAARQMRAQAETYLEGGNVRELLDSLRGWLDNARRIADRQEARLQRESEIVGSELVGRFGTVSDPLRRQLATLLPPKARETPRRQRVVHPRPDTLPAGSVPRSLRAVFADWWRRIIGGPSDVTPLGQHSVANIEPSAAQPSPTAADKTRPAMAMPGALQRVRQQMEQTYRRWIHDDRSIPRTHHGRYDPHLSQEDEPAAASQHVEMHLTPGRGLLSHPMLEATVGRVPLTLTYGAGLLAMLALMTLQRVYRRRQMRQLLAGQRQQQRKQPDRKTRSTAGAARRRTRSPQASTATVAEDEPSMLPLLAQHRADVSTAATGSQFAEATRLVNITDALSHAAVTVPLAVLMLAVLEYTEHADWSIHLAYTLLVAGQLLQWLLRNIATRSGRLYASIGETLSYLVVIAAGAPFLYTSATGDQLF